MSRSKLAMYVATLAVLFASPARADTQNATYPWQLLSGGYDSSINDGRILAYPDGTGLGEGFFTLVENSIMTMTADNGGFSRSAMVPVPGSIVAPGDVWENSNGGRGFTSAYCGGYTEGCEDFTVGALLGGPPSGMDDAGNNYSPNDLASGGWPEWLLVSVGLMRLFHPEVCIAPAGLDDSALNACAPGMTYRTGGSHLFASPDAGRQWYPFASSCGIPWSAGADNIAVDSGKPGHIVTARNGAPDRPGDASGCTGGSLCSQRSIAWTNDVSPQIAASIAATLPGATDTTHAVDLAGGQGGADWRYAALGHLALTSRDGTGPCDVAHAGIQKDCHAQTGSMCHATKLDQESAGNVGHEQFCPDYGQADGACECKYLGATNQLQSVTEANCAFPQPTSLAIDPRNGAVYAPSAAINVEGDGNQTIQTGLLYSPDGGRKWRRHGHSLYTEYGWWQYTGVPTSTAEPWPYEAAPPVLDGDTDPGVKILTMQGMGIFWSSIPGTPAVLDLNAQPELIQHMGRVTFASTPCESGLLAGEPPLFHDPMGSDRPRVRVTAVLATTWQNPIGATLMHSGVFIAHGDSCTDAAGKAPLVFRDTTDLPPMRADARLPASWAGG